MAGGQGTENGADEEHRDSHAGRDFMAGGQGTENGADEEHRDSHPGRNFMAGGQLEKFPSNLVTTCHNACSQFYECAFQNLTFFPFSLAQ
jgi:hypothetical protein